MELRWKLPEGKTLAETPIRERRLEMHMGNTEFNRIKSHLTRQSKIRAAIQKEIDKKQKAKKLSKDMVKDWSQTIEGLLKEKHETFFRNQQEKEEKRSAIFEESQRIKAEQNRLFIEKARKSLYIKEDYPRALTFAMKCGQVEQEREKQIELKKMIETHEKEMENEYAKKVKKAALEEVEEKREAAKKRREAAIASKNILYQQILDKKAAEKAEYDMKMKLEVEANIKTAEEIEALEKQVAEEAHKYKVDFKKSCDKVLKTQKELKEKATREDEDQELVMKTYLETKHRIDCMKKRRELDLIEAKRKKAQSFGEANEAERFALEEKENANIAKANEERDRLEEERRLNDLEKLRLLKEDCRIQKENHVLEMERKRICDLELAKWSMLNRCKINDTIKEDLLNIKQKRWIKVLEYRNDLFKQMNTLNEKRKNEKGADNHLRVEAIEKYKKVDQKFFDYASEVNELSKKNGWNNYGINRVIGEYKRVNGLVPFQRHRKCVHYDADKIHKKK